MCNPLHLIDDGARMWLCSNTSQPQPPTSLSSRRMGMLVTSSEGRGKWERRKEEEKDIDLRDYRKKGGGKRKRKETGEKEKRWGGLNVFFLQKHELENLPLFPRCRIFFPNWTFFTCWLIYLSTTANTSLIPCNFCRTCFLCLSFIPLFFRVYHLGSEVEEGVWRVALLGRGGRGEGGRMRTCEIRWFVALPK